MLFLGLAGLILSIVIPGIVLSKFTDFRPLVYTSSLVGALCSFWAARRITRYQDSIKIDARGINSRYGRLDWSDIDSYYANDSLISETLSLKRRNGQRIRFVVLTNDVLSTKIFRRFQTTFFHFIQHYNNGLLTPLQSKTTSAEHASSRKADDATGISDKIVEQTEMDSISNDDDSHRITEKSFYNSPFAKPFSIMMSLISIGLIILVFTSSTSIDIVDISKIVLLLTIGGSVVYKSFTTRTQRE